MTDTQQYFNYLSEGKFSKALKLVKDGLVDINVTNESGENGLMFAAASGDEKKVLEFLKNGANINAQDNSGNTFIMKAAVFNNPMVISTSIDWMLKKTSAEIDFDQLFKFTNSSGENLFTLSARLGNVECIKSALEFFPSLVDLQDALSRTALMSAISAGKKDIISDILHFRAKVTAMPDLDLISSDSQDKINNPVVLAAAYDIEILKLLRESEGFDFNIKGVKGVTPLMAAASANNFECFAYLLENGAEPNAIDDDGDTVLHYVLFYQKESAYEFFEQFLEYYTIDLSCKGSAELSIEEMVYLNGDTDLIRLLGLPLEQEESQDAGNISSIYDESSEDEDMAHHTSENASDSEIAIDRVIEDEAGRGGCAAEAAVVAEAHSIGLAVDTGAVAPNKAPSFASPVAEAFIMLVEDDEASNFDTTKHSDALELSPFDPLYGLMLLAGVASGIEEV